MNNKQKQTFTTSSRYLNGIFSSHKKKKILCDIHIYIIDCFVIMAVCKADTN